MIEHGPVPGGGLRRTKPADGLAFARVRRRRLALARSNQRQHQLGAGPRALPALLIVDDLGEIGPRRGQVVRPEGGEAEDLARVLPPGLPVSARSPIRAVNSSTLALSDSSIAARSRARSATSGGTSRRVVDRIIGRDRAVDVAGRRLLAGDAEGGEHRIGAAAVGGDFVERRDRLVMLAVVGKR